MTVDDEKSKIVTDLRDYLQTNIVDDLLKDQVGLNVKFENRDGFKKEHGIK